MVVLGVRRLCYFHVHNAQRTRQRPPSSYMGLGWLTNQDTCPLLSYRCIIYKVEQLQERFRNQGRLNGGVHPVKTPLCLPMTSQLRRVTMNSNQQQISFGLSLYQTVNKLLSGLTRDHLRLSFAAALRLLQRLNGYSSRLPLIFGKNTLACQKNTNNNFCNIM